MKRVIIIASVVLTVNLLAGLLLTFYTPMNIIFTSLSVVINTLLVCLLFTFGTESTHRLSLAICFFVIGMLEFISAFFAPDRWTDNWWLIMFITLIALQFVVSYLSIHYSKDS